MGDSYSFLHMEKIKTAGHMVNVTNHNLRRADKDNIITELSSMNREYISLKDSMVINERTADRCLKNGYYSISQRGRIITVSLYDDYDLVKSFQRTLRDKGVFTSEIIEEEMLQSKKYTLNVKSKDIELVNEIMNGCCIDKLQDDLNNDKLTCYDAFQSKIANLGYYENHSYRKNAVLGYEAILTYTRNADIDPYEWADESIKWLHETFDKSPDKKGNVVSAVLHMDEPGNPHIHAVIIPIDEKGHLNASRFTNGFAAMTELQSSYADAVAHFGLKRGVSGSSAEHRDINKMYAELNNIKNVPKPKEGETTEDYYKRIQGHVETQLLAGHRKNQEEYTRNIQKLDEQKKDYRQALADDMEEEELLLKNKIKKLDRKIKEKEKKTSAMNDHMLALRQQIDDTLQYYDLMNEEAEEYKEYRRYARGLKILEQTEPEMAAEIKAGFEYVKGYGDRYEEFSYLFSEGEAEL